jgi:hypothetical protein
VGVTTVLMIALVASLRGGQPPAALLLAIVALLLAWYWLWMDRMLGHYLWVAGASLGLAVLELLGASPVCAVLRALPFGHPERCGLVTLTLVLGVGITVVSVLDHRVLASTFRPLGRDDGEQVPS